MLRASLEWEWRAVLNLDAVSKELRTLTLFYTALGRGKRVTTPIWDMLISVVSWMSNITTGHQTLNLPAK